jgi:hypothetical protein
MMFLNTPSIRHWVAVTSESLMGSRRSIEIVSLRIAEIIKVEEHIASVA